MILCFQCEDLSKILLVSKFEMNRPNIDIDLTFFPGIIYVNCLFFVC